MRNFLMGLLLGWLATYCYLTQGDFVSQTVADVWDRVSAPPLARHVLK